MVATTASTIVHVGITFIASPYYNDLRQKPTSARVLRAATVGHVRILSTSTAAPVYVATLANTARQVSGHGMFYRLNR